MFMVWYWGFIWYHAEDVYGIILMIFMICWWCLWYDTDDVYVRLRMFMIWYWWCLWYAEDVYGMILMMCMLRCWGCLWIPVTEIFKRPQSWIILITLLWAVLLYNFLLPDGGLVDKPKHVTLCSTNNFFFDRNNCWLICRSHMNVWEDSNAPRCYVVSVLYLSCSG
jgi:hypothetical protein